GATVILTATPDSGNSFSGWSGCDTTSGAQCTLSVSGNKTVTATFSQGLTSQYVLTLTKTGAGSGTVTSSPTGISCGTTCSNTFTSGTFLTLTAVPDSGSAFSSWSGCDSATGSTCSFTMSTNKTVWAAFTTQTASSYTLTAGKSGSGNATITSSPGGITCGSTCSKTYSAGTTVTLDAWPDNNSSFTSWSGCDSSSGSTCYVSVSSDRTVSAALTLTLSNDNASAWIKALYNQYSSWFGSPSGSVTTATAASGTYYVQWYTNGAALVAWTDGNMYTYYNGSWYSLGISWQSTNNLYVAATGALNSIYNQYVSWYGAMSGNMLTITSSSGIYYVQWYSNGAALTAWTDGNIYGYYNGSWYDFKTSWTNIASDASAWLTAIYNQYSSWFGSPSGGVLTATASSGTYYTQWFTNGAALVAWTDGNMYTWYNNSWIGLGISWR
ncbi:MAG: hypothetical protein L7F77_00830, partial [Candidatus Magnetominusculus sp. LBB02]|nr:hypothetical protein [Candidatus Magnetominusculus sp. LBB02]